MKYFIPVMAGLCLSQPALAASAPPTTVMMGTVAASSAVGVDRYRCSANPGPAMFQRGAATPANANPPAIIDLPSVGQGTLAIGSGFLGVLVLRFTSATGGSVGFDLDQDTKDTNFPSGKSAAFSKYKQVWTPASRILKVTFDVVFTHCTLPMVALFRTVS